MQGRFKGEKSKEQTSRIWPKFKEAQQAYEEARDAAQIKGEIDFPDLTVSAAIPLKENQMTDAARAEILNCLQVRDQIIKRLIAECCEQYPDNYIFEYGRNRASKSDEQFLNSKQAANTLVNRNLKSAAKKLDISPFSFHSARHSFAHHLRSLGKDILFISRALGHGNLQVTVEYLKGFSDEMATKANAPIVETLNRMY